jgi:two-component system alkaline phosphatase synthesis response regulator PhoP
MTTTAIEPTGGLPLETPSFRPDAARILYVDDEPSIRALGSIILTRAGYSVKTVADGLAAWDALNAEPFDLVVTDHDMPGLLGLNLVARARLNGLKTPFIIASGYTDRFHEAENRWLGLAALLQKPFGPTELVSTVLQVLQAPAQT